MLDALKEFLEVTCKSEKSAESYGLSVGLLKILLTMCNSEFQEPLLKLSLDFLKEILKQDHIQSEIKEAYDCIVTPLASAIIVLVDNEQAVNVLVETMVTSIPKITELIMA